MYLNIGGMQDDKEFFRQARRFSAEILSDFKGNQRGMEEKDLSDSVLTVFRSTQRCVQKGNRPCAQRHTRTDSKSYLPPSAGFTACATCCLWNASDSILKYSTNVNTQISFLPNSLTGSGWERKMRWKLRPSSRCSSSRRGPWWRRRRRNGYTGPWRWRAWP